MYRAGPAISKPVSETEHAISAAKVQLLNLDPIKDRLGSRWARLSVLVHKLFETALKEAQAPGDHFLALGELSYAVTFRQLSTEQAALACRSVAQKVAALLFGADDGNMEVRSLVGAVTGSLDDFSGPDAYRLFDRLEETGIEIVVSTRANASPPAASALAWSNPPGDGWLGRCQKMAAKSRLHVGFSPLWDLHRRKSNTVVASYQNSTGVVVHDLGAHLKNPKLQAELETGLLYAAAEYAHRLQGESRIAAVSAGVSYESLCAIQSRQQYLSALKDIEQAANCPLIVAIINVPAGAPVGRVAELAAMVSAAGYRVMLQFEGLMGLPNIHLRLGVCGIGAAVGPKTDLHDLKKFVSNLIYQASEQKAFSFLVGLREEEQAKAAKAMNVNFGSGGGISKMRLSGLEACPSFPLAMPKQSHLVEV